MGNLSTIQHPSHDHSLTKLLVRLSPYSFKCYLCYKELDLWAYQCYKCEFYIHERCAESPPSIPSHPLHPQHPLSLSHGVGQHSICGGCHSPLWSGITYSCEECDFRLDFSCAVSALPRKDEEEEEEGVAVPVPVKVEYFVHEHQLMRFDAKSGAGDYCWVCKDDMRGAGCGCFVCKLFLHDRCLALARPRTEFEGELPAEEAGERNASATAMEHPLHGQHPLHLYIGSVPRQCHACKSLCPSSMTMETYWCYKCDQCRFSLDVTCATMVVPLTDPGVTIPCISHDHRLAHFFAKAETFIKCVVCEAKISGDFPDARPAPSSSTVSASSVCRRRFSTRFIPSTL